MMSDSVWRSTPSCLYTRILMPPRAANTSLELSLMPARHVSIVGIPTCMRTVNERVFHGVNERYPIAVVDATGCLPMLIPAIGSKVDVCVMLDRLDGLLLTGSPSNVHPSHYGGAPSHPETMHDPARDATTLPLIREAVRRDFADPGNLQRDPGVECRARWDSAPASSRSPGPYKSSVAERFAGWSLRPGA
jgi:hypothetical protein